MFFHLICYHKLVLGEGNCSPGFFSDLVGDLDLYFIIPDHLEACSVGAVAAGAAGRIFERGGRTVGIAGAGFLCEHYVISFNSSPSD